MAIDVQELAQLVNSVVAAREMEKRQRAGVRMCSDWSANLDQAIEALAKVLPVTVAIAGEAALPQAHT